MAVPGSRKLRLLRFQVDPWGTQLAAGEQQFFHRLGLMPEPLSEGPLQ